MKLVSELFNFSSKIWVLFFVLILVSCNAVKNLEEDELLLTQNTIYEDSTKVTKENIQNLVLQRPNSSILGFPLRLNLYNQAKKNPDSSYRAWLERKPKRRDRLESLLSEKQVERLGQSFVVSGFSNLMKRVGEPPVIIDSSKTKKSAERLEAFYGSKGYFNSSVDYERVETDREKRAKVNYYVDKGPAYIIDTVTTTIPASDLDSLYQLQKNSSFVKQGKQFDLDDFNAERNRLSNLFRNSGVYNFQESSISFDILRDTTLVADDQKMNVDLRIKNRPNANENQNSSEYSVHRFEKINVFTDFSSSTIRDSLSSVDHEGYTIWYDKELKFRPKALADAIFFEKDSVYSDLDRTRTLRQITNLNSFRYPTIDFQADSLKSKLISNIYLAPRPKYSLSLDFDISRSNIQQLGVGLGASVISRNVFGGAETLSLTGRASIGILDDPVSDENITSEFGGDVNLTFPRIWFPLNTEQIIPYYMIPQTRLSIGTNFQRNVGLDRQSLNAILGYNWVPSDFVRNSFELMNIEFVRNTNPEAFFNVYGTTYRRLDEIAENYETNPAFFDFFDENVNPDLDSDDEPELIITEGTSGFTNAILNEGLAQDDEDFDNVRSIEERRQRLTENNLIFSSSYVWQKNNRKDINDNEFYQFRLRLESAGNFLAFMENIVAFNQSENNRGLVFGVPYTQYLKTELDFVKYWDFSNSNVLAFHSFFGMAVPYGNSESIPFVRSYFAGGSNDNRAWNVYSLGPGSTDNLNDFNEANLKIAFNLEYRFPIVGDIKGALFADAGNIWNVFDNVEDEDATFNGLGSLQDIALGTGFGLRYDFTYFVIRIDTGFKTYNPALTGSERWFSDFNLSDAVINIGINYPF